MTHHKAIRNVLIFRPDNLGDIVLFSGVLRHIRSLYTGAKITLFVKKSNFNLLALCPYVDEMVEWEKVTSLPLPWLPEIRGKYRLNHLLRHLWNKKYQADVLLLPVRSPTGALFGMHDTVASICATEKIGITGDFCNQSLEDDRKAGRFYSKRMRLDAGQQKIHELEINREFLRFLGVDVDISNIGPEFWTDGDDRKWAYHNVPVDEAFLTVAVCPGVTSSPGKFYPGIKFAEAFHALNDIRFSIVLFGAASEKPMCSEVARALSNCKNVKSAIDLSGQTTIRQVIEGIRRCDAVISQETGALHIGVALKKPTVGIMGGGHFGRFYPWGDASINRTANIPMDCYWCNWKCGYPTRRCIQEINPEIIATELKFALREAGLI